jgi:hypothetical protein
MFCAVFLIFTCIISSFAFAEDTAGEKTPKVKGIEIVPDTATSVINKVDALLTGDLTCTMSTGRGKYRDDCDTNPLGIKIPRRTLGKYDDGVR